MRTMMGAIAMLALAACGDPLVDPQTVVGLRILGAKISTPDAPKSTVAPGEQATAEWLVLADKARGFSGLALWCEASSATFGPPNCREPFHTLEFEGDSSAVVQLPFTLPSDFEGEWVHWFGICEQGAPRWSEGAQRFECTEGEALSAVYRGNTSVQNDNPSLADDRLFFGGEPWLAVESGSSDCDDEEVARLDSHGRVTIRLEVRGADRESIEADEYGEASRESLVYTHVTTWPGLERAYSVIDATSTDTSFELGFANEGEGPSSNGELVRFAVVVRDGRGGSDWLERWFCLQP